MPKLKAVYERAVSIPSHHMGPAALPSPAAHPVPSPRAPWPAQGSAAGSHRVTVLHSHCCNSRGMRMQQPFTQ